MTKHTNTEKLKIFLKLRPIKFLIILLILLVLGAGLYTSFRTVEYFARSNYPWVSVAINIENCEKLNPKIIQTINNTRSMCTVNNVKVLPRLFGEHKFVFYTWDNQVLSIESKFVEYIN